MIALLALWTTTFADESVLAASVGRLLSVEHACNTLQQRSIDAYGLGSRGWGIFVARRNAEEAIWVLREDAMARPYHYSSLGDGELIDGPLPGEARRPLNVGRKSLSTLGRDANMLALVSKALEEAQQFFGPDEDVFVSEVYFVPMEYRSKDGSMRVGYSARVQLSVRGQSNAKGELRIDVWDEGKQLQVFGGWADS